MKKNRRKKLKYSDGFKGDQIWGACRMSPKETGLEVNIWITSKVENMPGPQMKVQRDYEAKFDQDLFSLTVGDKPEILAGAPGAITKETLEKIFQFIIRNKETLLGHWEGDLDSYEAMEAIMKTEGIKS